MKSNGIQTLMEKLLCDFVLADPREPETLSGLLPILKQIHGKCMQLPLNGEAKDILKTRKIINTILNDNPADVDKEMTALEGAISTLSSSLQRIKEPEQALDHEPSQVGEQNFKTLDCFAKLERNLNQFSSLISGFCPGEIPDLGSMLNLLDILIEGSKETELSVFHQVANACKHYVENMTLENISNTRPVEEGLVLLKSILCHVKKGKPFSFDYEDVLEVLGDSLPEKKESKIKESEPKEEAVELKEDAVVPESPKEPESISDEDMEILTDFVSEAEENLDTIEVNLIDLEQDPSNTDIINDIFRPFHTIKGVSGFLSLTKINKLAHTTENLLDGARSGDFLINHAATDAILESVDTLKKLIGRVKNGLEKRMSQQDEDINIDALKDRLQHLQTALANGDKEPLGEILIREEGVDRTDIEASLKVQLRQPDKKLGEILIQEEKAQPEQISAALAQQTVTQKKMDTQVKVSTQKLDDLVDYAGELVIAQSMLRQKTAHEPLLSQNVAQLGQIVANMQNIAMSMRMIPIKATFMKMIRLVRDLSRKSGKEVSLNMVGEDTEIDRNVVDALYEPMVHMIRNSVDHGIEPEAERLEKGKTPKGEIILRAYHKGGHILIEIEDDGKGLDKDRILEKAKSTKLISENANLTDAQIYDLIMQPGFSTASKITDVSGRGVGMDVVKDGIEKFRGQLNIESSKDKGTKFTINLPLTLAIIDGMLVRVDNEKYVIPTIAIQKAFRPAEDEYFTVEGKGEMVKDRGNLVPVIRLNEIYKSSELRKPVQDGLVVVVESKEEKRALLIDELLGKDEYVIKSLGNSLEGVEGIAGGAILSDGRVGLILDIHGIFSIV